ncbi:MAG: metal-dependent hydrolase, partial [Methylocella sp.]
VSLTQALHSSGTIVNGQSIYLGSPNGVVVKPRDAPCLYHMGDTDVFSDMGLIAEIHSPKIGLVPIGDRFTMSGRTAALAVKRFFKFDTVVPCHYGTFDLLDQDASHFVAAMQGHPTKVVVPRAGEVLAF